MSGMKPAQDQMQAKPGQAGFDRVVSAFAAYTVPFVVVLFALGTLIYWGRVSYFASGAFQAIPMLEGVVLALSLALLLVAAASRKWLYVLFAGWLVGNLRLTALSMGWDTLWLGQAVPLTLVPLMRAVTIALYYILTYALFTQLFRTELAQIGYARLQAVGRFSGVVLLVAALVLPYEQFLYVMWGVVGVSVALVAFLLVQVIRLTRSVEAVWYSVTLAVVIGIGSGAMGLFASALHIQLFDDTVMHIAAAFVSSLLIALVIANSERKERHHRIKAQAELSRVYNVAPVGLFTLSMSGTLTRANPALLSMLGVANLEGEQALWENHFGRQAWIKLVDHLERNGEVELEMQNLRQSPDQKRSSFRVKAVLENDQIEGSLQDITGHAEAISQLRMQANRDPLTDTLNHQGIDAELRVSLERMAECETYKLGYLELNSLKTVNNLYGKAVGDDVLRQICERVKEILGLNGQMGRLTGSEFLLFFTNVTLEKARELAQKIIDDLLVRPLMIGGAPFKFKCSMGLVELEHAHLEPEDAIVVAKRAARMARTSQTGQVMVQRHDARQLAEQGQELRLLREFNSGFSSDGLSLVMQPIMSLSDPFGSLNFEVLLRKHDRNGRLVPTGKIIAAAEESGVMSQIDRWVVNTTLSWLDENAGKLDNTAFVCVNLSGMSLNDEPFVEEFFATFERYAHVARKLLVEITETVALHDLASTRSFITRLQSLGARVALDDFGAGYTSFAYLKQLPANALKIDGAFIRSMNDHPTDVAIVRAIVTLAQSLNMFTIAEWAEDIPTLRTLKDLGVDYVQGYVISRPQSPELIPHASSSAGFIDDHKTRQFVGYYVQPNTDDSSRTL